MFLTLVFSLTFLKSLFHTPISFLLQVSVDVCWDASQDAWKEMHDYYTMKKKISKTNENYQISDYDCFTKNP